MIAVSFIHDILTLPFRLQANMTRRKGGRPVELLSHGITNQLYKLCGHTILRQSLALVVSRVWLLFLQ